MSSIARDEFLSAYQRIDATHQSVKLHAVEAVELEHAARYTEAIEAYENCLRRIAGVFAIPVGLPDDMNGVQTEWEQACKSIKALKVLEMELSERRDLLYAQHAATDVSDKVEVEDNNSSEPAAKRRPVTPVLQHMDMDASRKGKPIKDANGITKTFEEVVNALRKVISGEQKVVFFDTVFEAQAKLYKIEPNGVVKMVPSETSMSLVLCTVCDEWQFLNGVYFLQCAMSHPDENENTAATTSTAADNLIWIYPLLPGITSCYRTEYGAFILPDLEKASPGHAFGIMLTEQTASVAQGKYTLEDLQQFLLDLLEAVLGGSILELQPQLVCDTSEKISRNIISTADFIAKNLVRGAEKSGELMMRSTPYLMSKMNPAPSDAAPVSTTVQTSVEVARTVTSAAAGATGWLAGKIGAASSAIGAYLAPHIQTQGTALLQRSFGYDHEEAHSKMEGALTIAAGAVEGVSTVYSGVETSARILGTNLSQNSVKIIEHKYGQSAGNVAAGTFDTLGNAFNVSQNVNYISPKGIAKKMAKQTGTAVVDDYKRALRDDTKPLMLTDGQRFVLAGALSNELRTKQQEETNQ